MARQPAKPSPHSERAARSDFAPIHGRLIETLGIEDPALEGTTPPSCCWRRPRPARGGALSSKPPRADHRRLHTDAAGAVPGGQVRAAGSPLRRPERRPDAGGRGAVFSGSRRPGRSTPGEGSWRPGRINPSGRAMLLTAPRRFPFEGTDSESTASANYRAAEEGPGCLWVPMSRRTGRAVGGCRTNALMGDDPMPPRCVRAGSSRPYRAEVAESVSRGRRRSRSSGRVARCLCEEAHDHWLAQSL